MKKLIASIAVLALFAGTASANCVGTGAFSSCYDAQSGNNYTVMRSGSMTSVYGNNTETGNTWSQQSYGVGTGTEMTVGQDSDGETWARTCTNGNCY